MDNYGAKLRSSKHQSSAEEIRNLLGVADTKTSDYQKAKALSAESTRRRPPAFTMREQAGGAARD
jgi:hypothetical protein